MRSIVLRQRDFFADWWPRGASNEGPAVAAPRRAATRGVETAPEPYSSPPEQEPTLPLYHDGNLW